MDLTNLFLTAAGDPVNFCVNTANIWQIVGYVLFVFKIVIPILLIVFGMIDLGKAVVASKPEEVKKATTSLAFRAIGAVIVFLLPTLISLIMGLVSDFKDSEAQDDFNVCKTCITRPTGDDCDNNAKAAWGNETSTSSKKKNG